MIHDAFEQRRLVPQSNGAVSIADFALWLQVVLQSRSAGIGSNDSQCTEETVTDGTNSRQGEEESVDWLSPQESVSLELDAVKSMMGFSGFTSEDVMDLLG